MFDWTDIQPSYVIYTDGGANRRGEGGWAYVIVDKLNPSVVIKEDSGYVEETTSNRMELRAAIEALNVGLPDSSMLDIYTDSEYLQKGAYSWVHYWIASDWHTKAGRPVENVKLWKELYNLMKGRAISWHWVRGHSGNRLNEHCDRMVREAIETKGRRWKYVKSAILRKLKK